jgi:hypothetical protein
VTAAPKHKPVSPWRRLANLLAIALATVWAALEFAKARPLAGGYALAFAAIIFVLYRGLRR